MKSIQVNIISTISLLDTGSDEKAIGTIYSNFGYKIVDIIEYPNGMPMTFYETGV